MWWHWIVTEWESTCYFVYPLYVNNVVNIMMVSTECCWLEYPLNCWQTAAWQCFLFDIQQVTVSTTDSSVLWRVHGGKISWGNATHRALLRLLLSYLGSILVWPCSCTLAYKQTPTKRQTYKASCSCFSFYAMCLGALSSGRQTTTDLSKPTCNGKKHIHVGD